MANLTVYRGMKLTKDLAQKLDAATREKGFSSPSAFIRAAIENELISRMPAFDESEERIVATMDAGPGNEENVHRPAGVDPN